MLYLLRVMNKAQRVKLIATLTLYYYRKMKRIEVRFRKCKNLLLSLSPDNCEVGTLFGRCKISTVKQAELDYGKLLKAMDHRSILDMSVVRVNLIRKHLGNKFDTVVKSWYYDKQVLFVNNK